MKSKFIIIALLIASINSLFSENIDSLKLRVKETNGVELISSYNKISYYYYHTDKDSAYKYANKALQLLNTHYDKHETIETYNILGMITSNIGLYEEGFIYLFKALRISEEIKDTFQIARLYNNIGVSYMQIKEFSDAEKFLKKSLEYKDAKSVRIGPVYNNLGLIKELQSKNKEALNYINLAHKYYIIDKDTTGIASALGNIGSLKIKLNNIEEGYTNLQESYNLCLKLNDYYRVAIIMNKLAIDYYLRKNDYNKSIELIHKSIDISKTNNLSELLLDNYYSLSIAHAKKGNYRKALEYEQMGLVLQDSIYSIELKTIVKDINFRYEDVRKTKKIEILKKESQINYAKEKSQRVWIIILTSVIILLLIAGFVIYKYKIIQDNINENIVRKNIEIVKQDEEIDINTERINSKKYKSSALESDNEIEIAYKIKQVLITKELYKNPNFTIGMLSESIFVNRTYVSQVINNYFKKNFNSLINEYRVKEARKMLLSGTKLSIEGVSREVGFRSKSVFNASFKALTGVTPSVFIENANNHNTEFNSLRNK